MNLRNVFLQFLFLPTFPFIGRCLRRLRSTNNFGIVISNLLFLNVVLHILFWSVLPWLIFKKVLNWIIKSVAKDINPLFIYLLAVNIILRLLNSAHVLLLVSLRLFLAPKG